MERGNARVVKMAATVTATLLLVATTTGSRRRGTSGWGCQARSRQINGPVDQRTSGPADQRTSVTTLYRNRDHWT